MAVVCPACEARSETTYRCDECGKDLVEESSVMDQEERYA